MDTRKRPPQPKPLPMLKDKEVEQCAADDDDDDDDSVEEEEEEEEKRYGGVKKKKKKAVFGGGGGSRKKQKGCGGSGGGGRCQAEKCAADLTDAKRYHRRHKVCELHAKASAVVVAGLRQRFCQQCSRFHELFLFDDTKRSCRTRLAGHNERRRKSSSESHGEGSGSPRLSLQLNESHRRRQADDDDADDDDRGSSLIAFPGNPTYKQFHIH